MVEKSIIPGLDFKLKGGRCDLKRNLVFSCFMEKLKRKMERLGTLVILLVIHPITPPWVKLELNKRNLFQVESKAFPTYKVKDLCNWSRSKVKS